MSAGCAMLAYMVIREAQAEDWPAIWPILKEVRNAGETLTWDPARTEACARPSWMRELPGRTIVAVDDDGRVIGSANTHPIHSGPGAHVANAGFVVHPARRGEGAGRALCGHVLDQARADGYRAMQFNAVVETNTSAIWLWRSFGFEILARCRRPFSTRRTDTSASISCTGDSETSRRTHFGRSPRRLAAIRVYA
jgi:L-amino acid N-acyltransferase YncA